MVCDNLVDGAQPDASPVGRPFKYKTKADLDAAINSYFVMCEPHQEERLVESGINEKGETIFLKRKVMTEQKPYTVSGLALHIGLSRQGLLNYKERDEFVDWRRRGRMVVLRPSHSSGRFRTTGLLRLQRVGVRVGRRPIPLGTRERPSGGPLQPASSATRGAASLLTAVLRLRR